MENQMKQLETIMNKSEPVMPISKNRVRVSKLVNKIRDCYILISEFKKTIKKLNIDCRIKDIALEYCYETIQSLTAENEKLKKLRVDIKA